MKDQWDEIENTYVWMNIDTIRYFNVNSAACYKQGEKSHGR